MDAKQIKFLQLFGELSKIDPTDVAGLEQTLLPIIKLEFELGTMIWEYLCRTQTIPYSKDADLSAFCGDKLLEIFYNISSTKTINAITDPDVPIITQFVFEFNPNVDKGLALQIVQDSVITNKHDLAHIYLTHISRNRRINFGDYLKTLVEHAITQHIKKLATSSKNMPFPKKQAILLQEFIDKIRGANKALLTQRLKEIS